MFFGMPKGIMGRSGRAMQGTLESVLAHAEQMRPLRLRAALTESAERLRRNDALIRLEGEAALPYAWEALRWEECALTTGQILRAIGL